MSFQLGTSQPGQGLAPFRQAAKIAEILEGLPIEIPDLSSCRIDVEGSRVDIFGAPPFQSCSITDMSKIKNVSIKQGVITIELNCPEVTELVLHLMGEQTKPPVRRAG